ncbi:hypothetical protein PIB30_076149 [Stylosanthes scabra]|uniref:Flavoprotein domain-containing protein n=1 Tax=Stylosanthes scabra TaxID=79078 RepID=A0ABU6VNN6_9FABA|nr:hypothetical protein [Stylosanthes scabra]
MPRPSQSASHAVAVAVTGTRLNPSRRRSSSWRLSSLSACGVPPQRLYIVPAFALARVTVPPFAVQRRGGCSHQSLVVTPVAVYSPSQIVRGSSCNLLTSIVRAWDYSKPMFVATAMNTLMWRHPLTERHCISIDDLGINLIPPPARELDDPDFISNTQLQE